MYLVREHKRRAESAHFTHATGRIIHTLIFLQNLHAFMKSEQNNNDTKDERKMKIISKKSQKLPFWKTRL